MWFEVDRAFGPSGLRMLFGGGSGRIAVDPTPHDEEGTLLANELASSGIPLPKGWATVVTGGLVRDRET